MSSLGPVAAVGVLMLSFMAWLWLYSPDKESEMERWLEDNQLSQLKQHPEFSRVKSLEQVASLQLSNLGYVSSTELTMLETAVDRLKFDLWLKARGESTVETLLRDAEVTSMKDLCALSASSKLMTIERTLSLSSVHQLRAALRSLNEAECGRTHSLTAGWSMEDTFWLLLKIALIVVAVLVIFGGVVYCFALVIMRVLTELIVKALGHMLGIIITGISTAIAAAFSRGRADRVNQRGVVRMTRSLPTNTRKAFSLGLYERIRGSYLDHTCCTVEWNTADNGQVGGSTVVTIQLLCKNTSPYLLQTSDNFQCSVRHNASGNIIPHVVEPSLLTGHSCIRVSYTTRISGRYVVELKVNGRHITDSPYNRHYTAGPVDAGKTVFVDQTAVIVVTKGVYSAIRMIPRDSFGNTASIVESLLTLEIKKNCASGPPINPECVIDQEQPNRYELLLKVEEEGYFVSCVKYGGQVIGPSSFSIISLSESDNVTVEKNISKKNLHVWYEATLLGKNGRTKTVYCYISPRQLQVREYFMKIIPIPSRVFSCKVCPATRLVFGSEAGKFTIDDSYQEPVTLESTSRDILAATFYKFVLKNIGGSEKFQDKQTFFYRELKNHHKHNRSELKLGVSRFDLLESARRATKRFSVYDWCKKFVVEFQGEEGLDWGGVSREFFQILSVECFDISNRLFVSFNKDNMQALVHPNPSRPPHLQLKHYEFAGKLVGKCLYESACGNPLMVKARFSRSFLAQIIGLRINYKYFSTDDPDLYTTKIQYIKDNDVTDLGVFFAEEEFDSQGRNPHVVPLKENGAELEVTEDNKLEYLDLLAQYRLAKNVREEIDAFLKGLNEIVPDNLLSIFDENELELLMCGVGKVSFDDLKRHAVISGSSPRFQIILSWFWTVVSSFTQEEMAKLLQFVTGCSQLPPGGFTELSPKFQITSAPTRGRLPTAHTCFNQLCLPDYDSCEQFQSSLMMALNEGTEGFGLL